MKAKLRAERLAAGEQGTENVQEIAL